MNAFHEIAGALGAHGIGVVLKVSVLLAAAALIATPGRRLSAASRHFIWALALTGSVAIVVLAALLPPVVVTVPGTRVPGVVASWLASPPAATVRSSAQPSPDAGLWKPDQRTSTTAAELALIAPMNGVSREAVHDGASGIAADRDRRAASTAPLLLRIARWAGWPELLALLWFTGVVAMLARCVLGHAMLARLIDRSRNISDAPWLAALPAAAERLGVRRPVRVLVNARVSSPVTCGWLRPVILLPEGIATWDAERREVVLLHELAHVVRADYLVQLAGTLACALFWFHPAMWLARARLRAEGERAADDRVLGLGMPPTQYAMHLLALADHSGHLGQALAPAIGMARQSQLEGRLRAMLDNHCARAPLSSRTQRLAGGVAFMALVPMAALRANVERVGNEHTTANRAADSRGADTPATADRAGEVSTPDTRATDGRGRDRSTTVHRESVDAGDSRTTARVLQPAAGAAQETVAVPAAASLTDRVAGLLSPRSIATPPAATLPSERDTGSVSAADSLFEETLRAASGELLELDLRTGGNVILHAWDEPSVRLRARLGGESWRDTRVAFERVGGGIRLRAEFAGTRGLRSTAHEFELWVPRHTNLAISSSGGGLTIRDVEGDFRGTTGGGNIDIEGARGSAALTTGGGSVNVSLSDLSGTVTTGGGRVTLAGVTGGLRGVSGSGEVYSSSANTGASATNTPLIIVDGVVVRGDTIAMRELERGARRPPGTSDGRLTRGSRGRIIVDGVAITGDTIAMREMIRRLRQISGRDDDTVPRVIRGSATRDDGTVPRVIRGSVTRDDGAVPRVIRGSVTRDGGPVPRIVRGGSAMNNDGTVTTGNGAIAINKSGGEIIIGDAPNGGTLHTGGGDIRVRSAGGTVNVLTGGGNVELERVTGDADVTTGAGDIVIRVVNGNGTVHNISARSGSGHVTIELPADLDAEVDLETGYTESYVRQRGHGTDINSDVRLNRTETTTWEGRDGMSPRKFVRGTATFGGGRGHIEIRTVNGDITVRRSSR